MGVNIEREPDLKYFLNIFGRYLSQNADNLILKAHKED